MAARPATSIALVTDNPARSRRLSRLLNHRFHVELTSIDAFEAAHAGTMACVVDADLSNPATVSSIRRKITGQPSGYEKYFVINDASRTDMIQANSLGARDVLRKSCIARDTALLINRLNERLTADLWQDEPASARLALTSINLLNDNLYTAISTGSPLPKTGTSDCCEYLVSALADAGLDHWLCAVRQHHSYTYRHSMIVSGLAVSFAMRLGMRRGDIERLGVGALMHDVGKMQMPLGLLDKPGALNDAEWAEIKRHPVFGADILRADGQFGDEAVDIALHHHEYLDGSGYPDGLKGGEISDPVRIMTIVDIFAALIDERSYKPAMPSDKAYRILTQMQGKVDRDILAAFEPVAGDAASRLDSLGPHAKAG